MTTTRSAALATLLCLGAGPALAATCHMTVQGVPVIDDQDCTATGRAGNVIITDATGDTVRIRGSGMSGRFVTRRPSDGRPHRVSVSYGRVVASRDDDETVCYFNEKATLCVDP